MHELAICGSILRQVAAVALAQNAGHVSRIVLQIGPLAGVEPELLRAAFPIVAAGSICEDALIEIEEIEVCVLCHLCGATSHVRPNRLLCADCGTWRVKLVSGDEMLLARIELSDDLSSVNMESVDV